MKRFLCVLMTLAMLLSCASFALADERPTLTILMTADPLVTDYKDNTFTKMIEDACNVNLEFVFLPAADAYTKLNVMLSSGEKLPDVINYGLTVQDAYNYGNAGAILPLDELLEKYGKNFNEKCEQYPELLIREKSTAADGHIYGIPRVFFASDDSLWQNCWINVEWLEKLGLEMPTTTEELYNVLVAFRDQDPNGNGEKDEIPMTGTVNAWSKNVINYLLNSFVYWDASEHINVKDGQVYATYATEEWKEGVLYIKKLLAEGLLDPQCFTQTKDQQMALVQTEGISTVGSWMNMSPRKVEIYQNLAPVTGPSGFGYAAYNPTTVEPFWFVTADCADPDLAVQVGDFMFSGDQTLNLTGRYGAEGVYWNWVEESDADKYVVRYELPEGIRTFYQTTDPETNQLTNCWNNPANEHWRRCCPQFYYRVDDANVIPVDSADLPMRMTQANAVGYQSAHNIPPMDCYIPYILYTAEETEIYNDINTDLKTYVDESMAAFMTGTRDIEAEWDSYLAQLEALRLPEFLNVVQQAYDRMYK